MNDIKQFRCWCYSAHWYLVEMLLNIPASEIEWNSFVVPEEGVNPGNWQCPYMEQYLNEEGTERLCGVYETPGEDSGHCRVAFFLYKTTGKVLRTSYGEFPLSGDDFAPERLRSTLEFKDGDTGEDLDALMTVSYTVTKKRYLSWAVERSFGGIRAVVSLMLCLIGGSAFGMAFSGGFQPIFLIPAFLFLYYAFFGDIRKAAKRYDELSDEYGEDDWKLTITLEEGRICWEEGTECGEYSYSDIKNAYEKKDQFCLAMRDGVLLRLYKTGIQEYTADECWDLIERKMDDAVKKR